MVGDVVDLLGQAARHRGAVECLEILEGVYGIFVRLKRLASLI